MPTHQIQHKVKADGRVVLEDLPVHRGESIRVTVGTGEDPFAVAPPVSDAELATNQERLSKAVISENLDPEEPLLAPGEWGSLAG